MDTIIGHGRAGKPGFDAMTILYTYALRFT